MATTDRDVEVVVTGLGMISPMGIGREAFWEGILAARSCARTMDFAARGGYPTTIACPVDDAGFDPAPYVKNRKSLKLMSRATRFGVVAAAMALEDAGLRDDDLDPGRSGVVFGAGGVGLHDVDYLEAMLDLVQELRGGPHSGSVADIASRHLNPLTPLKMLPNITAAHIAVNHGLRGENLTVCTACTSGAQAIGEALRVIRMGFADVMLAGGADAMINPTGLLGFGMLGVLSRRCDDPAHASRPFDRDRDGFVMGEGGVVVVLETRAHALLRGATPLARVLGYSACSDAYRITDERPDGEGCADAMRRALEDAGVAPADVQYVNAHGTGTPMNDSTEVQALKLVFGDHARRMAVSSTKSQIGHLVAAAGAAEFAATVLALRHQVMPPTINYQTPDPECDLDFVPNRPREARLTTVMSNSFGFGGQNACLVLGKETVA